MGNKEILLVEELLLVSERFDIDGHSDMRNELRILSKNFIQLKLEKQEIKEVNNFCERYKIKTLVLDNPF